MLLKLLDTFKNRRTGRVFYSLLFNKLGLNHETSRALTFVFKRILFPVQYLKRKLAFINLGKPIKAERIDERKGFKRTDFLKLPYGDEALNACKKIIKQKNLSYLLEESSKNSLSKPWRTNILEEEDFLNFPEIIKFASSNQLLSIISTYLGTVPIIGDIRLWVSTKNDKVESSQKLHIDQEDYRQLKLFLYIEDVTSSQGPLTFFPASKRDSIFKIAQEPFNRVHDHEVGKNFLEEEIIEFSGNAGDIAFLDTSRCFHFGSRVREGRRITLMIPYLRFHSMREASREHLSKDLLNKFLTTSTSKLLI